MPAHTQGHISGVFRPGIIPSGSPAVVVPETAPIWNTADKGVGITLSNGDCTVSNSAGPWLSVRSVLSKTTGKWHAEFQLGTIDAASSALFGVCNSTASMSTYLGNQTKNDYVLQSNAGGASYYWNATTQLSTSGLTAGSTGQKVMVSVDFDAGKVWLGKNGTYHNSGDPAAGTNATVTFTAGTRLYLAASVYGTSTGTLVVPAYTPTGFTNFA